MAEVQYIMVGDRCVPIGGEMGKVKMYVDGKGYIEPKSQKIYVFSRIPITGVRHDNMPRFWVNPDTGKYAFAEEVGTDYYTAKNAYSCTIDDVRSETVEGEKLYDDRVLAEMNASTSIFRPIISEADDFMKQVIKTAINRKGMDIRVCQAKADKKYQVTNLKSALVGATKTTVSNFLAWCELLDIGFSLEVFDNKKDGQYPIKGKIRFDSTKGVLEIIEDEEDNK